MLTRHSSSLFLNLKGLSGIFDSLEGSDFHDLSNRFVLERAIMRLQLEFEHFLRKVILDSATGMASDRSGQILSQIRPRPKSREEAAATLLSLLPGRRPFEPDWYKVDKVIDAAYRLQISNHGKIAAVLGLTPWPLDDLRYVRNFVTHKSKSSALQVRALPWFHKGDRIDPVKISYDRDANGTPRYSTWTSTITFVAQQITL